MASIFEKHLDDYAELIMKVGLNYKSGHRIRIGALPGRSARFFTPIEAAPLVKKLVSKAYKMGAPLVEVFWGDPELDLIRYQHAPGILSRKFQPGQWMKSIKLQTGKMPGSISEAQIHTCSRKLTALCCLNCRRHAQRLFVMPTNIWCRIQLPGSSCSIPLRIGLRLSSRIFPRKTLLKRCLNIW